MHSLPPAKDNPTLQQGNCFENINKFILKSCENIAADLLLIMLYVLTFFLYTFLICSQVPIIMLLTKKGYKKLIRYLPGKEAVKRLFSTKRKRRIYHEKELFETTTNRNYKIVFSRKHSDQIIKSVWYST